MEFPRVWTGMAAAVAGSGVVVGQVGEVTVTSPSTFAEIVMVACFGVGVGALAVTLLGLRSLVASSRPARIGLTLSFLGALLLVAFAVQAIAELARTGDVPEVFALFALGLLLLVIGQVLFAPGLRDVVPSQAWILPIAAAAALLVAFVSPEPVHNLGLVAFGTAWVALGAVLLLPAKRPAPEFGP